MSTPTIMVPVSGGGSCRLDEASVDWYSWLSRAGLGPTVAYEYSLLLAHNELGEDDIPHFDHSFLLSMGISVGKHRLLILRLAQEECRRQPPHPVARLLAAGGRARRCLVRCLRMLAAGDGAGRRSGMSSRRAVGDGGRSWRSAVLKREKKLALLKQGRVKLTDGGIRVMAPPPPVSPCTLLQSMSPMVCSFRWVEDDGDSSEEDKVWDDGAGGETVRSTRWDSMFHNLRPT